MIKQKVGVIHPGEMGSFVAASALNSGNDVYWASAERSPRTRERAQTVKLKDAGTISDLSKNCSIIISVCPPHAAEEVASHVVQTGFNGIYLDANAISPQRVRRIGQKLTEANIAFVDGGIIGLPDWQTGKTWLYLAGKRAEEVADCFTAGLLKAIVIGDAFGKASALKMCYAAHTKGTTALQCAVGAAAQALGVWEELQRQWEKEESGLDRTVPQKIQRVTAKAWRFSGEMDEIAATFTAAGMPGGFHQAAADIYRRISAFKDAPSLPGVETVLAALLKNQNR